MKSILGFIFLETQEEADEALRNGETIRLLSSGKWVILTESILRDL